MEDRIVRPDSWREGLETKAARPEAVPIFGGTDDMVEMNFDRGRPEAVLDLTWVPEIQEWGEEDRLLRVGAGVTYSRIIAELGSRLPGLAMALGLASLDQNGDRQVLNSVRTNADGRTDEPLLTGKELTWGVYEIVFEVGEYFAGQERVPDPPILGQVPIHFGIADPSAHSHVPLLVSPWFYSTYRES